VRARARSLATRRFISRSFVSPTTTSPRPEVLPAPDRRSWSTHGTRTSPCAVQGRPRRSVSDELKVSLLRPFGS
jgi:hypothetical protein